MRVGWPAVADPGWLLAVSSGAGHLGARTQATLLRAVKLAESGSLRQRRQGMTYVLPPQI